MFVDFLLNFFFFGRYVHAIRKLKRKIMCRASEIKKMVYTYKVQYK